MVYTSIIDISYQFSDGTFPSENLYTYKEETNVIIEGRDKDDFEIVRQVTEKYARKISGEYLCKDISCTITKTKIIEKDF